MDLPHYDVNIRRKYSSITVACFDNIRSILMPYATINALVLPILNENVIIFKNCMFHICLRKNANQHFLLEARDKNSNIGPVDLFKIKMVEYV